MTNINQLVFASGYKIFVLAVLLSTQLTGCKTTTQIDTSQQQLIKFKHGTNETLPVEQRNRRKWDGPVVVDLDKDGLQDLILTDHGNELNVYWNLGGYYSEPVTLLTRDIHGVVSSDYDKDGKMEIVIAQGGGDGKNPKFPLLFEVNSDREIKKQDSMEHFEFTRGRAINFIDINNDGSLELITTGFPLKSQKQGANHLYKLDKQNQYQFVTLLPQAKWLGYRSSTIDIDNDGIKEIIFYGGADIVVVKSSADFTFDNVTATVLGELNKTNHVSSLNQIDFDNDGDDDLFITRAEHQFKRQQFYDEQNKRLAFFTFKKQKQQFDLEIKGDFELRNLQMAYPDFSVFVGENKNKLTFKTDKHSHKDITLTQQDAMGWPTDTSKKGIYIAYLGDDKWRMLVDTRARNAGVILNVINKFESTNLDPLPAKLFENVDGQFIDSSNKLNNSINEQTTSSAIADFNNDGWQDILVIKYGNMATQNKQLLLLNNQGLDFTNLDDHNVISTEFGATGNGANVVDYDKDGDVDVLYANERGLWHLFENTLNLTNNKNFIGVVVGYSPVNHVDQLDAKVSITACGENQQTTIGNGSNAFSQSLNNQVHFGLADCSFVDKVEVNWRNSEVTILNNLAINQYYNIE